MADAQPTLLHQLHVLRRQAWLVATVVVFALLASAAVTVLQDPVYRAQMKLVVGQGGALFQPGQSGDVQQFTQTLTPLIESDIVVRTAISELGLDLSTKDLLEDLHVSAKPDSSVLDITYDSTDKEQAVVVLAKVGDVFTAAVDERLGIGVEPANRITARIFDPAHLLPDRVAPKPAKNFGFSIGLGLALGLVLAFVRDGLDDRIRGRRDAEESYGAPVIGALPRGLRGKPPFGITNRPAPRKAEMIEALHLLRANLLFSEAGVDGPTILVTSALPEEGKSTVAANLGVILALAGHDVICVESDMRRPRLQDYLGVAPQTTGLADVVEGRADLEHTLQDVALGAAAGGVSGRAVRPRVRVTGGSSSGGDNQPGGRLRVLPTGRIPPNPADVLTPERVATLVDQLRSSSRYVIFDTPPLLLVGDAFPLVRVCDSVIVVAREGRTTRATAPGGPPPPARRGGPPGGGVGVRGRGGARAGRPPGPPGGGAPPPPPSLGVPKVSVVLTDSSASDAYNYGYSHYGRTTVGED